MSLDPKDPRATVVSAPAGSGKTTLLLHHYLRHLQTTDIDRIVAITFTRKAAAELTSRLAKLLQLAATPAQFSRKDRDGLLSLYGDVLPTRERALKALGSLQSAPVSTVDAFTLSLVQSYLLHAGLPLSDGTTAWIDAPVVGGASTLPHYESAARTVLEELSDDARLLLGEVVVSDAIAALAFLAQRPEALTAPGTPALLDALGDALRTELARSDELLDVRPGSRVKVVTETMLANARAWLAAPVGRPPLDVMRVLSKADSGFDEKVSQVARATAASLGLREGLELTLPFPTWDDEVVERSTPVTQALQRLATQTRDRALASVAKSGTLSYDELLLAATTLCTQAPPALAGRYDVLLVDELQDTNPQQLAFYLAFSRLREGKDAIRTFFVGDDRQSIYRFRQADPHGWETLLERAKKQGTYAELTTNYRSSKLLIEAQRALGAGAGAGVSSLNALESFAGAAEGQLDGRAPVLVVDGAESDDVTDHVLAQFAQRLQARWKTHPDETAAVLVRSWTVGAHAVRELMAHGLRAQLTGDRSLVASRAATDVRLFLRLLLDASDDLALVGVLKHPSIGLSDRALLHLKDGGPLGRVFGGDPLPALPGIDAATLMARLEVLKLARRRLGREPTADVLEWLASELHWRAYLQAGPEGQDGVGVAQLEVLLDVVRSWETQRVDPHGVVAQLDPDATGDELPVVRMSSGSQIVEVTTVHAAKGLEYDHVALLRVESVKSDGQEGGKLVSVARPLGKTLLGLSLDPRGALNPTPDPMRQWSSALVGEESRAECWRLFYVGFTRARKSVTFGIKKSAKDSKARNLARDLRAIFATDEHPWCEVVEPDDALLASHHRQVRHPMGQARAFEARWAEPRGWSIARPSSAADILGEEVVAAFKDRFVLETGPSAPPIPALSWLNEAKDTTLGQLVHGWLEAWGFRGEPTIEQAQAYIERQWSCEEPALAGWLVELGLHVRTVLEPMLPHKLHFEWPLVAVDEDRLWTGRADLIVEMPDRKVVVIDFKAGGAVARGGFVPHLETYAPQLEAYRLMLEKAGYQVVEVGLLFVRGVTWARLAYPEDAIAVA